MWWSFYRSKKKKWLARAQQVVGVCALRTERAVPPDGCWSSSRTTSKVTCHPLHSGLAHVNRKATAELRGEQKNWKNRLNKENRKKINRKNRTVKKNRLNRLKFWKNRPVRFDFGFISKKPNWTQTGKKPSQTRKTEQNRKNRAKPVWTGFFPKKPNRTKTSGFDPVLDRFQFF